MRSLSVSLPKPTGRLAILTLSLVASVLLGAYALTHYTIIDVFQNPIAYTIKGERIYVLEREQNRLLKLEYRSAQEPLLLEEELPIEADDAEHYYMVRKLYPGMTGITVKSHVFDKKTRSFLGYRFREYSPGGTHRDILTVYPDNPDRYPDVRYALGGNGEHYFANNCPGHYNIWRVPAEGNVVINRRDVPGQVAQLGETNTDLANWSGIHVDRAGRIYLSSGTSDRVLEYTPEGKFDRTIGTAGFQRGDLLAPREMFSSVGGSADQESLTVASTGNRTWVQFTPAGEVFRVISPLQAGYTYHDILVGYASADSKTGRLLSFDLANQCLSISGEPFQTVCTYEARKPQRTLLFLGLALLALMPAIFRRRMGEVLSRARFPLFVKLLILFLPLYTLSAIAIGGWVEDIMLRDFFAETFRRSQNLIVAALNTIDPADLEQIRNPEDRNGPAYARVYATMCRIVDASRVEHTPKWIIHKVRDGRFYYGINVWRGPIYEPFVVPHSREALFRVLVEKTWQHGLFRDAEGEWYNTMYPILNGQGEVTHVIELYRPTEDAYRATRKVTQRVATVIGITLLIAIPLILFFSYLFTRPLRRLMRGIEVVGTGEFRQKIAVRSRDEIATLADAFNQMTDDLGKYTRDLARATAERERIQSELRLARDMQQGIVPTEFPPFPKAASVEIFACMEPAKEVGGDFYDFFMIDREHIGVVVADVAGKGVPAGLFMMMARTLLRNNALDNLSAADALSRVNRLLTLDNPSSTFVTMFYLVCNIRTGIVTYCNAGHNPPLFIGKDRIEILTRKGSGGAGTVIGVFEESRYTDAQLQLAPGESLMLYTDGVTESMNPEGRMFGLDELVRTVQQSSMQSNRIICSKVFEKVTEHQKNLDQFDDITILFFKFLGEGGRAPLEDDREVLG